MIYSYGMRLRGFSIGCQPMEGFVGRTDSDKFWDIIHYDHELSKEYVKHYSLTPLGATENGLEEKGKD